MHGQIPYDPFVSDPGMKQLLTNELLAIKDAPVADIKRELQQFNVSTKGILDRADLTEALAKMRVRSKQQQTQQRLWASKDKLNKAKRLAAKVDELRRLSKMDVVSELRRLNVEFDLLADPEELCVLLAKTLLDAPMKSADTVQNDGVMSRAVGSTFDSWKLFNNTKNGVTRALLGKLDRSNFLYSDILYTPAESQAQEFLSNVTTTAAPTVDDAIAGLVGKPILNADDIRLITTSALELNDFDGIMQLLRQFGRDTLTQLLQHREEHVPKYAPVSALAAIFADSVLSEFNRNNDYTVKSTATATASATTDDAADKTEDTTRSSKVITNRKPSRRNSSSTRNRYKYDALAFEKDTMRGVTNKLFSLARIVGREVRDYVGFDPVLDNSDNIYVNNTRSVSTAAGEKSFHSPTISFVRSALSILTDLTLRLARYCGGRYLTGSQTLFVTVVYALLRKNGFRSILVALCSVKAVTVALAYKNRS